MIEFLFLDLDDTILDFHKAERIAIAKTFREFGLEPSDEVLSRYHDINIAHWQMLERGELEREQVKVLRFSALFSEFGMDVDASALAKQYESNLGIGHYFLPGAMEAVDSLSRQYPLYLASNGTSSVQHSRLTSAGLYPYFKEVFVSQNIGFNKPSPDYFNACFARIPGFTADRAMMVGDSLTSDILGGIQSGMKTCWINPIHKANNTNIFPDYELESITQLLDLLKQISK